MGHVGQQQVRLQRGQPLGLPGDHGREVGVQLLIGRRTRPCIDVHRPIHDHADIGRRRLDRQLAPDVARQHRRRHGRAQRHLELRQRGQQVAHDRNHLPGVAEAVTGDVDDEMRHVRPPQGAARSSRTGA
ncbi:hypothetical protein CKO28_05790 [Rhodovibrio sodomensis]|uniref:Uncharacterized protein n=1 Tax=Rhodovibrio sodomensis TaxID=1088 RepID=A0ABS1DAR8_9PROT|nr:hypothetical protein [Rhodovibrio sodomensis]